jgi:dienelactone hydrolase
MMKLIVLSFLSCVALAAAAPPVAGQKVEPVSFRSGAVTLSGTLYLPKGSGRHPAVVVFHSASGPSRDYPTYQHLTTALPRAGYAVLLFDRRGSGTSTGDFETASFRDLAADGIAGVQYLARRADIDRGRIGVWGISQGGWLGPLAATMTRDIAFVVAVSASGVSPAEQMDFAAKYTLEQSGEPSSVVQQALAVRGKVNDYYRGRLSRAEAEQAVRAISSAPWFEQVYLPRGGDLPEDPKGTKWRLEMDYDPLAVLRRVRVPMAFFYGESDRWVPVDESIVRIKEATRSNSKVVIRRFAGTDHQMGTGAPDSGGPVSREYVVALVDWLSAWLPPSSM